MPSTLAFRRRSLPSQLPRHSNLVGTSDRHQPSRRHRPRRYNHTHCQRPHEKLSCGRPKPIHGEVGRLLPYYLILRPRLWQPRGEYEYCGIWVPGYEPDGFLAFGSSFNRIPTEQVSNNRII
ncbi:unnamed protein product [Linum trigynum]|uniref:Uncharacterized protein n=1 Tax=Linum trigynum TaxID=586398 RepID=A0AAV2CAU3_9ROSI